MPSTTTPALPPDLEREIFEITVALYPGTIPALMRVSHRAKTWVEPHLYHALCITNSGPRIPVQHITARALRALIPAKGADFFRERVRHIRFWGAFSALEIIQVLSVCTNVVELSCWMVSQSASLLPHLERLPLQRFSGPLRGLFPRASGIDFAHPLFERITHLDLRDSVLGDYSWGHESWGDRGWGGLARLPRLTHLAFDGQSIVTSNDEHIGRNILQGCRALQAIVLVYEKRYQFERLVPPLAALGADPRFIMMVVVRDVRGDWERGVQWGADFWGRAETLIRRRGLGETDRA
ncbi:hypothetical protein DFH09DRAFT_1042847 [Mycena vulgaris]|nr:hypothetical protein DFH09DRAFT_1042847 [Mycena vulgaris]